MFIVIADSCKNCNERLVGLFDKKPSEKQLVELEIELGGMYCINSEVYDLDIDETIKCPIYED